MQQGFFSVQQMCPDCRGQGKMIKDPCIACHGQGRIKQQKTLEVKIPAGVDTGDRIRLSGEGEAGEQGAASGDLYVQVNVSSHPIFERDGNDLHCEVPISFVIASLGGDIDVPTLDGRVKLKIPSETQSGKTFRLRSKGVKSVRSLHAGDLFCHVNVETPIKLNSEQKDLLRQFSEALEKDNKDHSPKAKGWFEALKSFFE